MIEDMEDKGILDKARMEGMNQGYGCRFRSWLTTGDGRKPQRSWYLLVD